MAQEINNYSSSHKLNVEGKYDMLTNKYNHLTNREYAEIAKNDNISHFICRLAYCRNDDLRRWFATQETRLFYQRLASFEPGQVLEVLRAKCEMNYDQLKESDDVWQQFKDQITFKAFGKIGGKAEEYIKVPFKDALGLVSGR